MTIVSIISKSIMSKLSSYMLTVFPFSLPFQYVRNVTMMYSLVMTIVSIISRSIMSKL
jgi:hypothetical protein